ncbi:hypothetical protein LTR53_020308, partial [Teratosphaeriaceae sp. CCFEE 6253]
ALRCPLWGHQRAAEARLVRREEGQSHVDPALLQVQGRHRARHEAAMVDAHEAARRARHRGREERQDQAAAAELGEHLLPVDGDDRRLVSVAAAV